VLRLLARITARYVIKPLVEEFLEIYADDGEAETADVKPGYDPRSTIAGTAEVAANRDHDTLEVIARQRMGFTSGGGTT
jgi:hypothetical protein